MAEIRIVPQRRNRAIVLMTIIAVIVLVALVWYFLAGPAAATATGA